MCVTCPNLLKMGIRMGAMKSEGRTLNAIFKDDQNQNKVNKSNHIPANDLWPLLLTWFNFNPSMDK